MRSISIAAVSIALLAMAGSAYAASASGMIKSIDRAKDTVTLDNGATYQVPSSVKLSAFKVGEKVNVIYSQAQGKMKASELTPAT